MGSIHRTLLFVSKNSWTQGNNKEFRIHTLQFLVEIQVTEGIKEVARTNMRSISYLLGFTISFAFVLIGFTFFALSQLPQGFKGL